jgi:hypothetical protein
MYVIVRITLHRWFDMTKASKPVGWFWLPIDSVLNVLNDMHAVYVGDEFILPKAGKTANQRVDPQTVCASPLSLSKLLMTISSMDHPANSCIASSLFQT